MPVQPVQRLAIGPVPHRQSTKSGCHVAAVPLPIPAGFYLEFHLQDLMAAVGIVLVWHQEMLGKNLRILSNLPFPDLKCTYATVDRALMVVEYFYCEILLNPNLFL
ncbi:hypothetical protein [Actimicrobium sp. CCI2.3]|uniref:hypothetical protein n=1 Tax=Actimicrobium sp. CCI2.3 TaxID=3048616 RepID=UPI002AB57354|nr:hypothetical protein [Actimicrobium sp. CCI2.3]MDY7574583.1 hypothetical protein [Actimicrobium sp. CCI2.3]MEB0020959.1 hypothetical protein [Actimicrobium sp. CCI2.3]